MDYRPNLNDLKSEDGPYWQSGRMSYHCPRCNAGYTYKKTLKTHMKYDCGKEPRFKCPYYPRLSSEFSNSVTITSYVCPQCDAGYRRMGDLIRHKCGQTPRYACPYCHKKDNSSSNVYRHIRRWHPKMPIVVLCYAIPKLSTVSQRKPSVVSDLMRNVLSAYFHASSSAYWAVPLLPGRRRRRLPVNTALRGTFECPNCRKTYKWYRGLHRHLKYECGKAPRFKCPHCVYAGKHRSHVYSHIKSNHRNRPVYALDTQED
ncbi:hypothetical protein KPH14_002483 [Odynerus spinipes]|uniref:C2H2-type domain-containing protein n=1 Tax=Odynerus spinipes TaxID=1348599 RepID=A0AAD9RS11_9HYME|nr:hypothetical protein KPH14_002483 [Odynerus spinipes]